MQKRQSKSSKKNTSEIWKMWQNKNIRKEHLGEENCHGDLWQENCLGSQIKGMIKSIGEG